MIKQSWIPIGEEFRRLRAEFAEAEGENDSNSYRAENALLGRLATGFITARAEHCLNQTDGPRKPGLYFADDRVIRPSFWQTLIDTHHSNKRADWVTGDFSFEGHSLKPFEELKLGDDGWPLDPHESRIESTWFVIAQGVQIAVQTTGAESKPKSRGGRNPATWWREFAMELAVYMHDLEYPEGEEGAGQEEVYKALCLRMGADNQPSRTNALDVIGKVLKRVRAPKRPAS